MKIKSNRKITTDGLPSLVPNWNAYLLHRRKSYPFLYILFKQWTREGRFVTEYGKYVHYLNVIYKLQAINVKTNKECWIEIPEDELLSDVNIALSIKPGTDFLDTIQSGKVITYLAKRMRKSRPLFFASFR